MGDGSSGRRGRRGAPMVSSSRCGGRGDRGHGRLGSSISVSFRPLLHDPVGGGRGGRMAG